MPGAARLHPELVSHLRAPCSDPESLRSSLRQVRGAGLVVALAIPGFILSSCSQVFSLSFCWDPHVSAEPLSGTCCALVPLSPEAQSPYDLWQLPRPG